MDESTKTNLQLDISSLRETKKETVEMPSELTDIISATASLNELTDNSGLFTDLQDAVTDMENSIKQHDQITNPSGDFIIKRVSEIQTVVDIQGVTEDNDPNGNLNKQGGYTSATYFSSSFIDQSEVYGDGLIDKGTKAGGCVEVYPSEADAIKRDEYLSGFDGVGFLTPGSHVVFGTIVIRTSDNLTATQQNELTEQIKEILIELR